MFSTEDAGGLIKDLLRMLHEHELEQAEQRVQEARSRATRASWEKRAEGVAEISRAIHTLSRRRAELERSIEALPEDVRFHAQHTLMPMIWELFDIEIAALRSRKRVLSRTQA